MGVRRDDGGCSANLPPPAGGRMAALRGGRPRTGRRMTLSQPAIRDPRCKPPRKGVTHFTHLSRDPGLVAARRSRGVSEGRQWDETRTVVLALTYGRFGSPAEATPWGIRIGRHFSFCAITPSPKRENEAHDRARGWPRWARSSVSRFERPTPEGLDSRPK